MNDYIQVVEIDGRFFITRVEFSNQLGVPVGSFLTYSRVNRRRVSFNNRPAAIARAKQVAAFEGIEYFEEAIDNLVE